MYEEVPIAANRASYFLKRERNLTYWNVSPLVFRLSLKVDTGAMKSVAERLTLLHDGLRLQIESKDGLWMQSIRPHAIDDYYCEARLHAGNIGEISDTLRAYLQSLRTEFRFPGPLFRIAHIIDKDSDTSLVSFITHHLVADAYSARLITNEFFKSISALVDGRPLALSEPPCSYREYAHKSISYWLSQCDSDIRTWSALPWGEIRPMPRMAPDEMNVEGLTNVKTHTVGVGALQSFLKATTFPTFDIIELLLAAIARAYYRWTRQRWLLMAMVFQGRTDPAVTVSLNRTVGWLSETVPIILPTNVNFEDQVCSAFQQRRHAVARGKSYGAIRHLPFGPKPLSPFAHHPEAEVSLNITTPAARPEGSKSRLILERLRPRSILGALPTTKRVFLLSGGVIFNQDSITLSWDYSSALFQGSTIETFTKACFEELEVLLLKVGVRLS